MKVNLNNLDLDKLEDEYIPKEKIIRKKKDDKIKKKPNPDSKENDTYTEEEEKQ